MDVALNGIVRQDPIYFRECCIFVVEAEEGNYLILSTEKQADKDYVFVAEGQQISIKGSTLENLKLNGVFLAKQEKIILSKIDENCIT